MSAQILNVQARIAEIQAMIATPPGPLRAPAGSGDFASALAEARARDAGGAATAENAPEPTWGTAAAANGSLLAPGTPVARLRASVAARGPATVEGPAPVSGTGAAAPARAADANAGGAANRVLKAAENYLGVPYKWGGTNPSSGLDCSGFTQRVFRDLGVTLPRVSYDQARAGTKVNGLADARPGDLIYWGGGSGRPNHIGIYAGNGKMIHAPRTGDVVKYDSIRSAPPDAIRRVL